MAGTDACRRRWCQTYAPESYVGLRFGGRHRCLQTHMVPGVRDGVVFLVWVFVAGIDACRHISCQACTLGDIEQVRALLAVHGASSLLPKEAKLAIETESPRPGSKKKGHLRCALAAASEAGQKEIVFELLSQRAEVDQMCGSHSSSPACMACNPLSPAGPGGCPVGTVCMWRRWSAD